MKSLKSHRKKLTIFSLSSNIINLLQKDFLEQKNTLKNLLFFLLFERQVFFIIKLLPHVWQHKLCIDVGDKNYCWLD